MPHPLLIDFVRCFWRRWRAVPKVSIQENPVKSINVGLNLRGVAKTPANRFTGHWVFDPRQEYISFESRSDGLSNTGHKASSYGKSRNLPSKLTQFKREKRHRRALRACFIGDFDGCPAWIRTTIPRVRVWCPTVRRQGNELRTSLEATGDFIRESFAVSSYSAFFGGVFWMLATAL